MRFRIACALVFFLSSHPAHAHNQQGEHAGEIKRPIITRIDDAGIGWLKSQKRSEIVLVPSTGWNVDFADDSCGLGRHFVAGDETVIVDLRQFGPGEEFDITIAGSNLRPRRERLSYRFSPDRPQRQAPLHMTAKFPQRMSGVVFSGDLGLGVSYSEIGDEEQARAQAKAEMQARQNEVQSLFIETGFARKLNIEIGSLREAMPVMRQCIDNLVESWELKRLSDGHWPGAASPKNRKRFKRAINGDFPKEALERGLGGVVRIRLMIDEKGEPKSCHLQVPTELDAFRESVCGKLMKIAKFHPVQGPQGNAVPSYAILKVSYTLGKAGS